jgi:hypothetical protein
VVAVVAEGEADGTEARAVTVMAVLLGWLKQKNKEHKIE